MKRLFDVVTSSVLLIVFSPILLVAACLVAVSMGRPILFRQQRAGLHGRPFSIVKLRTMTQDRDEDGNLLPDADRLTRVGRFLRSTSVDELPGLWNVLRGDMSLVGPRPLLLSYLDHYSPDHSRRHEVKPGMTGLAQVEGRNASSWETRLDLDLKYVESRSLALDIQILARTPRTLLRRSWISANDHATMPNFIDYSNRSLNSPNDHQVSE